MSLINESFIAPNEISEEIVSKYFRYDSGAKEFKEIVGMKRFSVSTDAISLVINHELVNKVQKIDTGVTPECNMPVAKFNIS